MAETRQFVVPAESAGDRLDLFLVRQMPDWSRSQIQRLIREGLVTVGSAPAKKVRGGDRSRNADQRPRRA